MSKVPPAPDAARGVPTRLGELGHPLPAGMRDFAPPDARHQAELGRRMIECFELFGYELVILPVFEYAAVLERGLGALDRDEVLRFVEPESGAVVALRPDVTPQIARLVATRLAGAPLPVRLCYQGSVLRRRHERARRHRQIPQAGVELVGLPGPAGDLEILSLAAAAARAAGLAAFALDLSHARIAGALLEGASEEAARPVLEALEVKDASEVARRAESLTLEARERRALAELPELHGGDEVWARAEAVLGGTRAEPAFAELRGIWEAARAAGIAPELVVDLGETRSFAYYTGATFHIHAPGPGRPICSGGRYDGLLGGFGMPCAAAGFAFGLDELGWALATLGGSEALPEKVLLDPGLGDFGPALRARGVRCALGPAADRLAYAKTWWYSHALELADGGVVMHRLADGAQLRTQRSLERVLDALGAARENSRS
jgi:ATP phosphoribosyltransferase regulatory subunit